ncbi:MAG: ADP-glyceromanno-heptose 6-epimerase [Alphaproteobacteria bacterium]|nr:ADP-glyceromanno-heptose 6-epimerase [Alphaproteobacteria bacterium]
MIIVTGGAGFIGSNLVAGLEEKGVRDIVICDVLGQEDKWRNIGKRGLRDIVRPDRLFDYLDSHGQEVDAIFHMGAVSSTTEKDADMIVETNFTLSRMLWKWCANNKVRFFYGSSSATYGDGANGFKDDESREALAKLRPLNPYGWSKHVFDRRIAQIVQDGKGELVPPQWVGFKFFNVYGPNEFHKGEQMSVVAKRYPEVVAGAAAKLFKSYNPQYADGGQLRDFVWIDDCIDIMIWFLTNPKVSGLYNIGSGKARSFNDLADALFAATGKPRKITYIDMPEGLKEKYQYFTEADISKLRAAGYTKEMTSLEDGVKEYVTKYLDTAGPYR